MSRAVRFCVFHAPKRRVFEADLGGFARTYPCRNFRGPYPGIIGPSIALRDMLQPAENCASAPFDDPNADIIIRSCDGVQFRTYKLLLSLASPIFKDMLAIPQPQPLDKAQSDTPIVDLTESSPTIRRLLFFCYPAAIEPPPDSKLQSLSEIAELVQATTKYEMYGARKTALRLLFQPPFIDAEPLRVYAIACRFGADTEASLAAKHILRRPLFKDEHVAELEFIDAASLYRVMLYQHRCAQAAAAVASDHKWIREGLADSCAFFKCAKNSDGKFTMIKTQPSRKHKDGYSILVDVHTWWLEFMESTRFALLVAPSVDTIIDPERLENATAAAAAQCFTCGPRAVQDLLLFIEAFKKEVEERISQV
jgi:hypothetical protein